MGRIGMVVLKKYAFDFKYNEYSGKGKVCSFEQISAVWT
jgi:hypothetical protein